MSNTTGRLSLVQWVGTDPPSTYRTANTANTNVLDNAALYLSGTLAARPAANAVTAGTIYYATDASAYSVGNGVTWTLLGSPTPVGTLSQYAGASDPVDADGVSRWLICDARAISRTTYAGLFSTLSTNYGAGNGSTTFNIPDLRGRVPVGVDSGGVHMAVNHPTLASSAGEEQHALSVVELAAHNHTASSNSSSNSNSVANDGGHQHGYGGYIPLSGGAWSWASVLTGAGVQCPVWVTAFNGGNTATGGEAYFGGPITVATTTTTSTTTSTNNNGSGTAHNNAQPYLAVNHIIKVL